ncbi:glycerol dehydrogenase [Ignisphaera sp. 4213-co]|uniref:Glycerol dehydrogenase n=1 Tax=Ignisphaera cupida TaxID=3050454 RepID=A0ABD4Z868_9CREN|nr:glycerol dehydrogenase [Ignisphaera sp. 4213-co]MDK6029536.1 glycerol dehydrogenase [Ignisphaera sp. 4213-co]
MFDPITIASTFYIRGFRAPGNYIQGRGVLSYLGKLVKRYGRKALVLSDSDVRRIVGGVVEESLRRFGVEYVYVIFNRECSWEEINRVTKIALENSVDMVIGVGGGKTMDTAKAVAIPNELAAVMVPTIASTDAPTSAVSVIYTEPYPGEFVEAINFHRNPDMVVVDTEVIAKAPARFLACGMGDAASHYWETRAVFQANKPGYVFMDYENRRGVEPLKPFDLPLHIAKLLWETLQKHGVAAMHAAKLKIVTPSLEQIVYANTLLSGLAFENGGTSLAHAIGNSLSVLEKKMKPLQYHGEMVAFGTLVEILAEGGLEYAVEFIKWAHSIGLPVTFEELGLRDVTDEDLYKVAEKVKATSEYQRLAYEISSDQIVAMMKVANEIGKKYGQLYPRAPYE